MARSDIQRVNRSDRSPLMRLGARREPGLVFAMVLVIAIAPIGWFNAVGQLFLPTNIPQRENSTSPGARRSPASAALHSDNATPISPISPAIAPTTAPATATLADPTLELAAALIPVTGTPTVEAMPTLISPATDEPTAGVTATAEALTASVTPTPTPQLREAFTTAATYTAAATATAIPPTATPTAVAAAIITYVVQQSDTLWSIASRHGVDINRVRSANGLDANATIRTGQTLYIPQVDGVVHVIAASESLDTIARRYGVGPETIIQASGHRAPDAISAGGVLMIPGAYVPIPTVTSAPTTLPIAPVPPQPPAAARGEIRSASRPVNSNARLRWPAYGGISTFYGEEGHSGLDIMGYTGQPVVAAAAGVVVLAAQSDGAYGWRVDLDHGSGLTTVYAHLSSFSVAVGDHVAAGQRIAAVGNTGLSTGPHLHFEVRSGGSTTDPMEYLR